ncbi:MAG: hypothetical protein Q8P88_01180 [Candidatus Jorgensenbacteria bacterium]|nr:hypothetical protein [Candidatus Jorgensenbacteria bacterium]
MHWKGFFIVLLVFLVIYGVYYLVTQSDFVKLLSISRILNPFATSSSSSVTTTRRPPSPRASAPIASAPIVRTPTPPAGFAVEDLSTYYDKVQITSVRRPDRYGIGGEFSIRANNLVSSGVDVTGWEIRSNRGSITMSGVYAPVGPVNQRRIVISPNTSAVFYAAWSSFVKNIELNACTGYLNDLYSLSPKLPTNCPRSARSELVNFSGECQNFINSLSSCEVPDTIDLNRFTVSRDVACRAFMNNLTYEGCVRRYRDLSNFYSYGWRVWMGTELRFDPYHDRLLLFDGAGKMVDEYVY